MPLTGSGPRRELALPGWWRAEDILTGCCWACNVPITTADPHIGFDGDNLLQPGGPAVVAFHTSWRRRVTGAHLFCREVADAYERHWVAAVSGRVRRITCPGFGWYHEDGRVECTDVCPGPDATHYIAVRCRHVWGGWVPGPRVERRPTRYCGHRLCQGVAG